MISNEISSLTRAQAAAVKKRVDTLNATIRKKTKQNQKTDVRDVFSANQEQVDNCRKTLSFGLFYKVLALHVWYFEIYEM